MDFDDHQWKLKTYDQHGVAVVKIFCGECMKEIGGINGEHSRSAIQIFFTNFKKSHLQSAFCIRQWCKKKGILYSDLLRKEGTKMKPLFLTQEDHRHLVDEAVSILQSVNDSILLDDPLFVVVGDVRCSQLKSFWYKVCCKLDGEFLLMYPPKWNLRANLENHLHRLIYTKCMENLVATTNLSKQSTALSTGKHGRPTTRSRSNIGNQPDLHS